MMFNENVLPPMLKVVLCYDFPSDACTDKDYNVCITFRQGAEYIEY